ncbi:unnamed protein product [Hydatigera taeniaeformis]|uniref:DNA polymerase epsilon catalytic subunit n=1 Tax=Hydatigena taeniaeformis TaxID=6205 RepID=A0A158REF6_HYDTA|nr:unnamed protein product [Hydatigera taeniaeformis]
MCVLLVLPLFAISLTQQHFGLPRRDFFFNTTRLPRRYFNITFPTAVGQDYVRLKLHAFIFEVSHYLKPEKGDASGHLRQLMNPYPHILLDPGYTSTTITSYHPLSIQAEICRLFQAARHRNHEHLPTSIFVVNDIGIMVNRQRHDRLLQLFFQITASLGLPTLTWMPNRVGEFEVICESHLLITVGGYTTGDPTGAAHVARGESVGGFLASLQLECDNIPLQHSCTRLQTADIRDEIPSDGESQTGSSKLLRVGCIRMLPFLFEIDAFLPFDGFTNQKFTDCTLLNNNGVVDCFGSLLDAMQKIWESISRVIIFNGNRYDLNALTYIADILEGTENEHLNELFGTGYVWIFTPSTMAQLTIADQVETVNRDNIVLSEFTMFRKIPGMFGLICLNDADNRKRHAELAREVWHKSLMELVRQMTNLFPPVKPISLNSSSPETIEYYRSLLEKLRPGDLCESNENVVWQWGRRLNSIMRSLEMNFDGEPISFLPNGGLNVSKFLIFNSRTTNGRMNWFKVGTWSMSSKWGRSKSRLWIDGVTWPGGANSPPKGRAHRRKLKAVMLQEQPLLTYGNLQEDGSCDANSVPCWIRDDGESSRKKANSAASKIKYLNGTKDASSNEQSETRQGRQLACCTGLTMDLLIELMKDLNFEVELYEVKDRLWGGWTNQGWNGLVRELMDLKADMAITSLKITPNRSEQIDFSVPFLETGIAITVALREGAISPTAFLEPYDYQCWCIILLFSVHASGAAIYLYEWLSPVGQARGRLVTPDGRSVATFLSYGDGEEYCPDRQASSNSRPEHRFTMCRSLWLIWSMLFGAAVNADNPRGMASRFMANIWALFALVFLASYTANLAAFMISKDDFYDLKGIHDWRLQQPWNHKPPFRFATVPSGATEENIKINFPEMAAYMHAFNRTTVLEGLKSLKSEEIDAFIYDATVLEYWTSRDDGCKLKTVGNLYAMTGYGIGFPKGSRWLPKINSRILHYQKNGKSYHQSLLCARLEGKALRISITKPSKVFDRPNEGVKEKQVSLRDERRREECTNSACLSERYRSQQEIARLSRHLRLLLDEMAAKNEGTENRLGRIDMALFVEMTIDFPPVQRNPPYTTGACTVIKIPRTSWSNGSFLNRKSYPLHATHSSSQNTRLPSSIRHVPSKTHSKLTRDSAEETKMQAKLESCGKTGRCKELTKLPQTTTSQSPSPVRQPDVKSAECVEKESVI